MDKVNEFEEHADNPGDSERPPSSPLADIISVETVINVLIQKGLCTPEELFEEERKLREYNSKVKDISIVNTSHLSDSKSEEKSRRQKQKWLKRKMSKRRWTRRLGTKFLGWQWKKVKTDKQSVHIENFENNTIQ